MNSSTLTSEEWGASTWLCSSPDALLWGLETVDSSAKKNTLCVKVSAQDRLNDLHLLYMHFFWLKQNFMFTLWKCEIWFKISGARSLIVRSEAEVIQEGTKTIKIKWGIVFDYYGYTAIPIKIIITTQMSSDDFLRNKILFKFTVPVSLCIYKHVFLWFSTFLNEHFKLQWGKRLIQMHSVINLRFSEVKDGFNFLHPP